MRLTRTIGRIVVKAGYQVARVRYADLISDDALYQRWLYNAQPDHLKGIPGDDARLARWLADHSDGPNTGAQC